ncbi:MAG: hypothetical protein JOZ65_32910, partial [Chloroflexi bacterium]|nr:hypothetical protein [Chloroflexota bacterium]
MSDSRLAGGQVASVGARALERADWFRGLRAWSQWRQWLRDRWRTRGLGLHGRGPSGPGGFPAPALEFPATTQDACSEFPGVEPPPPAPDMQAELSSAPTLRAPIVRRRETALAPRAALTGARELAAPVQPAVQRERERLGASIAPVERPEPRPLASEWPRSVPATKSVVTQRRSPGERQAPVPPRASTSATATTTARTTTTSTVSTSVRRQQSQSSATP